MGPPHKTDSGSVMRADIQARSDNAQRRQPVNENHTENHSHKPASDTGGETSRLRCRRSRSRKSQPMEESQKSCRNTRQRSGIACSHESRPMEQSQESCKNARRPMKESPKSCTNEGRPRRQSQKSRSRNARQQGSITVPNNQTPSSLVNPAIQRVLGATTTLLHVNSNQKGGGGVAQYKEAREKLMHAAEDLAEEPRHAVMELLEKMKQRFQGKTPGTYRCVCWEIKAYLNKLPSESGKT